MQNMYLGKVNLKMKSLTVMSFQIQTVEEFVFAYI